MLATCEASELRPITRRVNRAGVVLLRMLELFATLDKFGTLCKRSKLSRTEVE